MLEWEEEEERGCLMEEEEACVAAEIINYSALHGSILSGVTAILRLFRAG